MRKWVNDRIWWRFGLAAGMLLVVILAADGCVAPATNTAPGAPVLPPADESGGYYREVPGPILAGDCSEFMVTPQETAAAVGSEVILVASVRGQDQFMLTNQRVEWTITPGGVGHFVDFRRGTFMDYLVGDFTRPRKITEHYVITSTSREYLRLTRGTVAPNDDVIVRPGQAWVSVTSPVEGTTAINVYVPCVHSWDRRVQTVFIHWVDAQWTLPPPAIVPAGSRHQLATSVTRLRDRSPCAGWKVRYEIIGGISALFAPNGTTSVEVPVDSTGRATAEIYQAQPLGGSTQVAVQIIRPADAPGAAGRQLTVGSGQTLITWSAAQLGVRVNAPSQVSIGGTTTVRVEINNPGDLPAENVLLKLTLPSGVSQQSTTPAASVSGATLNWTLGRLNPHEMRTVDIVLQFSQAGTYSLCAEAQAAGNLQAQHCATITAGAGPAPGPLELRVQGPDRATVGQDVTYVIEIVNRGTTPLSGLLVRDTFDAGLQHAVGQRAVERDLPGTLQPGETKTIGVLFRVVQPGRWCHTVQVSGPGGIMASQTACLEAQSAGAATTTPETPPSTQPGVGAPSTGLPSTGTTPGAFPGTTTLPSTPQPAVPQPTAPGLPAPPFGSESATSPSSPGGIGFQPPSFGGAPPSTPTTTPPSPSAITLRLSGPTLVRLGESATFTMELVNTGNQAVSNVQLRCSFDVSWEPLRASAGYLLEGETIVWTLASVEPNQTLRRQIELRAVSASQRACCRAELVEGSATLASQEACARVEPGAPAPTLRERPSTLSTFGLGNGSQSSAEVAPGGIAPTPEPSSGAKETPSHAEPTRSPPQSSLPVLKTWVIDRYEPITVGKTKTVTLVVQNQGNNPVHGVACQVEVPPEFEVDPDQTLGPAGKATVQGRKVIFDPTDVLNPTETVSFTVGLRAASPGKAHLTAKITCEGMESPMMVERVNTIIGP